MSAPVSETDHDWPSEITPDSRCQRCGLAYRDWDGDENYFCFGQPQ